MLTQIFFIIHWLVIGNNAGCDSKLALDLIFILDSSGSVYDENYTNWQSEIDFAKAIVNNSLPTDSKIGLINFSGCGPSYTFEQCKDENRLKKMWGLNDYGVPNDQQAVYGRLSAMGPADFNGGYTWTEEALYIALNEFNGNSSVNRNKMVILLTDGEPYPPNEGHAPCESSTGYISNTLQELGDLDTLIITVAIDVSQPTIDEYFTCIVDDFSTDFFDASEFDALSDLTQAVGDIVCNHNDTVVEAKDSILDAYDEESSFRRCHVSFFVVLFTFFVYFV